MGFEAEENLLVKNGGPYVVSHKWVQDSMNREDRLLENDFLMRKEDSEESAKVPMPTPPSSPIAIFGAAQFGVDSMDM